MENFPAKWVTDICNELDKAGYEMPDYKGGGKFEASRFDNSFELMKMYVSNVGSYYEHLNAKGLINLGYCPITGQKIGMAHVYQVNRRKIYLSAEGEKIINEYERDQYTKNPNVESMTTEKKEYERNNLKPNRWPNLLMLRNIFFSIIVILIIITLVYIIKKLF